MGMDITACRRQLRWSVALQLVALLLCCTRAAPADHTPLNGQHGPNPDGKGQQKGTAGAAAAPDNKLAGSAAQHKAGAVPAAPAAGQSAAASDWKGSQSCPIDYRRLKWQEVESGAEVPYLFGGIYKRPSCDNCHRGSLWPIWCNPQARTGIPFWDLQKCSAQTLDSMLQFVRRMQDKGPLLVTPCDLFGQLKGRTLWVIGDSIAKDLFKALKCFMLEFWDLNSYQAVGDVKVIKLLDSLPNRGQVSCVHMFMHSRMCFIHAIQGDLFVNSTRHPIGVLPLLHSSAAHRDDVFVVHFGLWHAIGSKAVYVRHLHELGAYFAATRAHFPNMFFMETPKQHFDSADGDFQLAWLREPRRTGPFKCQKLPGIRLAPDGKLLVDNATSYTPRYLASGTWRNAEARAVLRDTYNMTLISIYNETVVMEAFHRDNFQGHECSHFCHPSAPQLWVYKLLRVLEGAHMAPTATLEHELRKKTAKRGCGRVWDRQEQQLGLPKKPQRQQQPDGC